MLFVLLRTLPLGLYPWSWESLVGQGWEAGLGSQQLFAATPSLTGMCLGALAEVKVKPLGYESRLSGVSQT